MADGDFFQLLRSGQALPDEVQLLSRTVAVRPGGPGCSGDQDEGVSQLLVTRTELY